MSNYTTHAASFKATNINTRALDAKRIDTKKLFINGVPFAELQGKEKPSQAYFLFTFVPNTDDEMDGYAGFYTVESMEVTFTEDEAANGGGYSEPKFQHEAVLIKGSESNGILEDGIYAVITINDNFIQCIGGNSLEDSMEAVYMLSSATFGLSTYTFNNDKT